jgi:hypothetical protein
MPSIRRLAIIAVTLGLSITAVIAVPRVASGATAPYVHSTCSINGRYANGGETPTVTCVVKTNSSSAYLNEIYPAGSSATTSVTQFCTVNGGHSFGLDSPACEPGSALRPSSPVYFYDTVRLPSSSGSSPVSVAIKICEDGYTHAQVGFSTCQTVHISVTG